MYPIQLSFQLSYYFQLNLIINAIKIDAKPNIKNGKQKPPISQRIEPATAPARQPNEEKNSIMAIF
ncbi:unnamed protein product [Paramecium primaurelia]|uniref:Uncharacterized protein n=1 Tax=Paramecium primaurelia TaxID=5886 RepID=A0A8S1P7G3_PARPR|nr:unnamed protein product [Paramecium primaurelia]